MSHVEYYCSKRIREIQVAVRSKETERKECSGPNKKHGSTG
jgi:hypothetical protein